MVFIALLLIGALEPTAKSVITDIVVNRLNYEEETVLAEVTVRVSNSCQKLKKVGARYDHDRAVVLLYPEMSTIGPQCGSAPAESQLITQWIPLGRFSEGTYEIRDLKSLRVLEGFEIAKGPSLDEELVTYLKK